MSQDALPAKAIHKCAFRTKNARSAQIRRTTSNKLTALLGYIAFMSMT
jgi:hypothetical protein